MIEANKSYLAAYFTAEYGELEEEGFRTWLVSSFHSGTPAPLPPHFYTPELYDAPFGEVFSRVLGELDAETRAGVARSVEHALRVFPKVGAKFEGLLSLALLGEALKLPHLGHYLASSLRQLIPTRAAAQQLPDTPIEVYALRETLECGFRSMLGRAADAAELCTWALELLDEHQFPPELKPCLAPLYILASRGLFSQSRAAIQKEKVGTHIKNLLLQGSYQCGDPFEEFYSFQIDGQQYPYDLQFLLESAGAWMQGKIKREDAELKLRYNQHNNVTQLDAEPSVVAFEGRRKRELVLEDF